MPSSSDLAKEIVAKLHLGEFADRFRGESIPLGETFSYFVAAAPIAEEDMKEYLEEPAEALPDVIRAALPKLLILLVPFLVSMGPWIEVLEPAGIRAETAKWLRDSLAHYATDAVT